MSTDQRYLFNAYTLVRLGYEGCPREVSKFIKENIPGKMYNARWYTTAGRILRLYVSSINPSINLRRIAAFIADVYVPAWVKAKESPSISSSAKNYFSTLQRLTLYPDEEIRIVGLESLEINSFNAHPEMILLAMMADESLQVRQKAVEIIRNIPETLNLKIQKASHLN